MRIAPGIAGHPRPRLDFQEVRTEAADIHFGLFATRAGEPSVTRPRCQVRSASETVNDSSTAGARLPALDPGALVRFTIHFLAVSTSTIVTLRWTFVEIPEERAPRVGEPRLAALAQFLPRLVGHVYDAGAVAGELPGSVPSVQRNAEPSMVAIVVFQTGSPWRAHQSGTASPSRKSNFLFSLPSVRRSLPSAGFCHSASANRRPAREPMPSSARRRSPGVTRNNPARRDDAVAARHEPRHRAASGDRQE